KRVALLPDAPSVVEAGYPDAVFRFWVGLSAPARTPAAIVNRGHDATRKALQDPGLNGRLAELGVGPVRMGVDACSKYVRDDIVGTAQLAKQGNIEPLD